MLKYKNVYFGAFDTENNKNKNTKLSYDSNCIYFTTDKGEQFNLKFKNTIEDVLVINDGIMIKFALVHDEFEFFFLSKKQEKSFMYYIISNHPLNNISNLGLINSQDAKSLNIVNVVKSSSKFPFIIAKGDLDGAYKIYLLMHKEQRGQEDFNNYLNKIMYTNLDTTFENFNVSSQDSKFSLFFLCDVRFDFGFEATKINIYTTFLEKKCIFFSFFGKCGKFYIVKFKFDHEDTFSFEKSVEVVPNVCNCRMIEDILKVEDEEEIFEKEGKSNKNIILNFLNKKSNFGIKNKTLCILDNMNKLSFVFGNKTIFSIDINEKGIQYIAHDFTIEKNKNFTFKNGMANDTIILDYNLNNSYLNMFLKYLYKIFKVYGEKNLIYKVLENILHFTYRENKTKAKNGMEFEILLDYLLLIFTKVYNFKKVLDGTDLNRNFKSKLILLSSNTNEKKENNTESFFFTNLKMDLTNSSDIITFFDANKENLSNLLVNFCLIYFETLKIENYNNSHINLILKFAMKLLEIKGETSQIISYSKVIYDNYGIYLNKNIHSTKSEVHAEVTYKSFLDYLLEILNNEGTYLFPNILFSKMINFILILSSINKKIIPKEFIHLTNKEVFILMEYNLFLKNVIEKPKITSHSCLSTIINSDYDIHKIKQMHPLISLPIIDELDRHKLNPYSILTDDNEQNYKLLSLIDRLDLAKNLTQSKLNELKEDNTISSLLYENQTSNYESDYYLTNLRFDMDTRFKEAMRILNPNRIIKVNTTCLSKETDPARIEVNKFNLMLKNLVRQYSSTIGFGAIGLNSIKTFPKDILNIKYLNLVCVSSTDETTFKLDNTSDMLKDKDFNRWTEFHNGVSHVLKLSTEFFTNKSYIRNWILLNKPNVITYEHGGFLFGLGLLKQLDSLYSTDIYQYMKPAHDGVTIGILLGRATSKIASMEESLSRTLCLHIAYLIPQSLELNIPINIQCAATIGLGLLYLATGNRLITEMLLNQIGKKFISDKNMNVSYIESYNLSLGFSIGMINLGMGKLNINEDLRLEEKLINFANGGKKIENVTVTKGKNNNNPPVNIIQIKKTNSTYTEENEVDILLTAPAAYSCLSLIYLQSNNQSVANKIKIPNNVYQLNNFKPFHLYLAILTKNLIMWDGITNSESWVYSQIPDYIKFLYEEKLSTISEDVAYSNRVHNIEFSLISTCYFFSIAAAVMSLGFKSCGSNKKEVANTIIHFINKIKKVKTIADIIVRDHTKYDDTNKFYPNKATIDKVLCICAYSLSLVMAGSGDLDSFKLLRVIRKKIEGDVKTFNYGYNQALQQAIGFLFLGAGTLTFINDKQSIALLYISIFPLFSNSSNCNEKYLQALRHLYVLACDNKILETRNIETNQVVRTNIEINYKDNTIQEVMTPVNIEDFHNIESFKLKSNSHYYVQVSAKDFISPNNMKSKTIFIMQKNHIDEKIVEIAKSFQLNFNTNSQETSSVIKNNCNTLFKILKDYSQKMDLNSKIIYSNMNETWEFYENSCKVDISLKLYYYSLVLLIFYSKNDNTSYMLIINDYLNRLNDAFKQDRLDFQMFRILKEIEKSHTMTEERYHNKLF